jgi:hypothetical protein
MADLLFPSFLEFEGHPWQNSQLFSVSQAKLILSLLPMVGMRHLEK